MDTAHIQRNKARNHQATHAVAQQEKRQTLWYLRNDVLCVLCDFNGSQSGRDKLEAMTEMFRGLVPANQMPSRRRTER